MNDNKKPTFDEMPIECVRRACAHLSEEEILEAEENFKNYMRIVADIADRLIEEEALTEDESHSSLRVD